MTTIADHEHTLSLPIRLGLAWFAAVGVLLCAGCGEQVERRQADADLASSAVLSAANTACCDRCTHAVTPAASVSTDVESRSHEAIVSEREQPETAHAVVAPQVPELSEANRELALAIANGQPIRVTIGGKNRDFMFRQMNLLGEDFQISCGTSTTMAADHRVYQGRELQPDKQVGGSASLALVNDAIAMTYESNEADYLIHQQADGSLLARQLPRTGTCDCSSGHDFAGVHVHRSELLEPETAIIAAAAMPAASAPPVPQAAVVEHPYFRLGPQYHASLIDLPVIWVSSQTQTGSVSELSATAAEYFANFAQHAATYEQQLGFRPYLMELVLLPEGSSELDPQYTGDYDTGDGYAKTAEDLWALRDWVAAHRPQSVYGWGHVVGWVDVEGDTGIRGWSTQGGYGTEQFGVSVGERRSSTGWKLVNHELGHNLGAYHAVWGAMYSNPFSLFLGNGFLYASTDAESPYTVAREIYNYMTTDAAALARQYGPGTLRHPDEMPYANYDQKATPVNTPVTIAPLDNDNPKPTSDGAENTVLSLVETGMLYPPHAGDVLIDGDTIIFTPATGFTGQAWLTYTMRGNAGNGGQGWMHTGDVYLTVGGDSTAPSLTPSLELVDDYVERDLSTPVRINPLLNDVASGRFGVGDVDALSSITGGAESYSDQSFILTAANIITGNGTLLLEMRDVVDDAQASTATNGYLVYTPSANDVAQVVIEYTAQDATGATGTAFIYIASGAGPQRVIGMTAVTDFTWQMLPGPANPIPTRIGDQELFDPVPAITDQVLQLAPTSPQ